MADVKLALLVLFIMIAVTPITPQWCSSSRPTHYPWVNTWHQSVQKNCQELVPFLSRWITYYRRCQGDRLHYFGCRQDAAIRRYYNFCYTTGYANAPMQYFFKTCGTNGIISGVRSTYDPATKDRRIRLRCCRTYGYKPGVGYTQFRKVYCKVTPYQNYFGQTWTNYQVPAGYMLTGVGSYFSSYYRDRRWRFQICQMKN